MKKLIGIYIVIITICLSVSSCQYLKDRGNDALDIITLKPMIAPRIALGVQIFPVESLVDAYVLRVNQGNYNKTSNGINIIIADFPVKEHRKRWIDFFDIDVTAMALIGLKFGINFAELADFPLGFVGVDIAKDDGDKRYEKPPVKPRKPRPSQPREDPIIIEPDLPQEPEIFYEEHPEVHEYFFGKDLQNVDEK